MIQVRTAVTVSLTEEALARAVQLGHERAAVEVAALLLAEARRTIETGTDPYGRPWAPLDPDTRSPTGQVGLRTGELLASITAIPAVHTPGVTRAEVRVGVPYASHFQRRRPILPLAFGPDGDGGAQLPDAIRARCAEIHREHVARAVAEAQQSSRHTQIAG